MFSFMVIFPFPVAFCDKQLEILLSVTHQGIFKSSEAQALLCNHSFVYHIKMKAKCHRCHVMESIYIQLKVTSINITTNKI